MASKKEIIQWVTIQIDKKFKGLPEIELNKKTENIIEKHIKDPIYRYTIKNAMLSNSRFNSELNMFVPYIGEKIKELCVEAKIYNSIINILNEVDIMYEDYSAEADEVERYNNKLKDLLASFKEGMLLISNGDLADYAKAFIESIRE